MKQDANKNTERQRGEMPKSTAHRKKLAAAFILFLIMAGLWIKVFTDKGKPKTTSAAVSTSLPVAAEPAQVKIVYTELPVISRRHNVIGDDFFSAGNFSEFKKRDEAAALGETDLTEVPKGQGLDGLEAAAKEMELLAIINDKKPQVFIEDKLLEEGQSFKFESGGRVYEFTVVSIMENGVVLECDGITVTKKIPDFLQAE